MELEEFKKIAPTIPHQPGVYKYYNDSGELIYIGKAKDLIKRISSYFNKTAASYKTMHLVRNIHHLEFTIVNSEQDAFLLENSLIKQFKPRYNINLKDDKSYPYIILKREPFPRIFLTRRKLNDGSEYLGPFTTVGTVKELLAFIKKFIPIRNCKLNLSDQNIKRGKFKVCLEYHLGNCKGPCEGLQSKEDYDASIKQFKDMLKGNLGSIIQEFRRKMLDHAKNMEFEKAAILKKKIEDLEKYQSRSVIVSPYLGDIDAFGLEKDVDKIFMSYLEVRHGTIVQTYATELICQMDESDSEILGYGIDQLRSKFQSSASEIVVPFEPYYPNQEVKIVIPKGGDRKKLLDLAQKNVVYYRSSQKKREILQLDDKNEEKLRAVLSKIQERLSLKELPIHIECFDNSNFQGSYPVSAMVCFKNGIPSKKDYRHFNVKTVEGIDDYATMSEVIKRRYERLKNEHQSFPQLVIIDGGKGQLNAAMKSIHELGLDGKMTFVGLAKQEEELFFSGDREAVKLQWESPELNLIRRIRDEVHHFGISFHRNKRSKGSIGNELEEIKGIGKLTAENILKIYASVKQVKEADQQDLIRHLGKKKAELVWAYFHPPGSDTKEKESLDK